MTNRFWESKFYQLGYRYGNLPWLSVPWCLRTRFNWASQLQSGIMDRRTTMQDHILR